MDATNKSKNKEESLKKINNIYDWRKIRNKYVLQQLFEHLNQRIFLKIIKYNKKLQKNLNIGHKEYKKYCEIEIEIIPTEDKYNRLFPFINFNNKEEESYYHIYYDDNKNQKKGKNRNYIGYNIKKIKIIIDYQVKSFCKLFKNCCCIKSINFIKFNRNDITNMSYMFYRCSSLKELNLSNFNTKNVNDMSHIFYGCTSLEELILFL